jgi:hypothetical protein
MNKAVVDIGQTGNISDPHLREWLFSDELFGGCDQTAFALSPGNWRPSFGRGLLI